jgi:hypothetical protein
MAEDSYVLSLITIPKAFEGHFDVIQRNAVRSWTLLTPTPEVILFGNEGGTAQACQELGVRHEPYLESNEFGTPLLSYAFNRGQQIAQYDWICYCNCDIILTPAFMEAVARLLRWRSRFFMVGRRTDIDITEPFDFTPGWERSLRELALRRGTARPLDWIDYFVFKRGTLTGMPPFAVGRTLWDWWVVWRMRASGLPLVDTSPVVLAVHQNHDYNQHPQGREGIHRSEEFKHQRALAGSWRHLNTIEDATHVLDAGGIRRTYRHWVKQFERERKNLRNRLLVVTGPARRRLGLRKENLGCLFKTE